MSSAAVGNALNPYKSMGKFSRRQTDEFFFFLQKIGFDISCKLSPKEIVCMKCQRLLSGKNEKYISKCRLLKFQPRLLSVKTVFLC